jgi:carboxyl-terminal processing protease
MHRSFPVALAWTVVAGLTALAASDPPAEAGPTPTDLAARILTATDAVLEHHIDPPARQQMVLDGLKGLYAAAGVPLPAGRARRVSTVATPEQLAALLAEAWPHPAKADVTRKQLEESLIEGLLSGVPGGASLASTKELKVAEQFEGNLYVGIHIALGFDEKEKRPAIREVFEGGPAHRAGTREGDLIEAIDGKTAEGLSVGQAVDRLRGEEGTDVVVRVRSPGSGEVRTLTMTRGRLPRPTITGVRKRPGGGWDVLLEGPERIGYLKIGEIVGSTPQELRQLARQLESEGARALILDLRTVSLAHLHPAVLLADYLLDGGRIGRVRTVDSVETYEAEPDALFRDWPLAVLVDGSTSGAAEWLCAALQDNHRAVIVGTPTPGRTDVRSSVPLPGGEWSIQMATGRMERGDGRPLARPSTPTTWLAQGVPIRRMAAPADQFGVTPDHPLGGDPSGRFRSQPQPRPRGPEPRDLASDPFVITARQVVAGALKSGGS